MEAVDRTFKDILNNSVKPFGGLTVVFGGDFRQILPVIIKGSRGQTVASCIQCSFLWTFINVLHLHQNMQLNTTIEAKGNFARWQLEVGQGMHTDEGGNITLPGNFKCEENKVASLINTIYPGIGTPNLGNLGQYFSEHTILSTLNTEVDSLNAEVLKRFSEEAQVFYSADSIPTSEQSGEEDVMLNYPVEYLNSINCSGLPLSKLELKEGCPIMVLRNLDVAHGVCNDSRGIVTRLRSRVLEVKLLTGNFSGQKVFIPRISNQPTEDQLVHIPFPLGMQARLCY